MAVTLEQILERKPTLENPVILKCNDGYWTHYMEEIRVYGVIFNKVVMSSRIEMLEHTPVELAKEKYFDHYEFIDKPTKPTYAYKEVEINSWMNVYEDGQVHMHVSRESADDFEAPGRIACYNYKQTFKYKKLVSHGEK